MALRREGKPVWLLEYPDGHIIEDESAKDFQVRQLQFFDHYLKGLPAPLWMSSDGINNAKENGTIQLQVDGEEKPDRTFNYNDRE